MMLLATAVATGACSSAPRSAGVVRLAYVDEVAQAAPIVGLKEGLFAKALGSGVQLRVVTFGSDGSAAAAISAGTVDAAYLDANAAYDAFAASRQTPAVAVVAGAASGGTMLVTTGGITAPADLRGRTIAVPRLGSAEDVALRSWLAGVGVPAEGSDGVTISAVDGPSTLSAFRNGAIDGAWLPEPWASRLVTDGGGRILVDERALWAGGVFPSAVLEVRADVLRSRHEILDRLLRGHVAAESFIKANPAAAQSDVTAGISALSGQDVSAAVTVAWPRMRFGNDPFVAALQEAADHGRGAGTGPGPSRHGLVDVSPLNAILRAAHQAPVGQ